MTESRQFAAYPIQRRATTWLFWSLMGGQQHRPSRQEASQAGKFGVGQVSVLHGPR